MEFMKTHLYLTTSSVYSDGSCVIKLTSSSITSGRVRLQVKHIVIHCLTSNIDEALLSYNDML